MLFTIVYHFGIGNLRVVIGGLHDPFRHHYRPKKNSPILFSTGSLRLNPVPNLKIFCRFSNTDGRQARNAPNGVKLRATIRIVIAYFVFLRKALCSAIILFQESKKKLVVVSLIAINYCLTWQRI